MGSNGRNLDKEIFLSLVWRREPPLALSLIWKTLFLETATTPKICPKMSNRLIWKVKKVSHHVYSRKTNRGEGRLFWPPLISLNSVKENRFEQSLGDILPNFFKRVLFSININLEPVFIEQIKNKAYEMLSGWSEVCSYITGYIYNIYLLSDFFFLFNMCLFDLKLDVSYWEFIFELLCQHPCRFSWQFLVYYGRKPHGSFFEFMVWSDFSVFLDSRILT